MIKAAECAGVSSRLAVWRRESMLATGESSRSSAMKSVCSVKSAGAIEVVAIDENSAVGNVGIVVKNDAVAMPVVSPVVPAPAESAKEADPKPEAKLNSRTGEKQPWIRIPARPDPDELSIHQPWVIFRHVNNLRVGWLDHNGLPLLAHLFLRCAL
jgi:hypothetical protein